MKFEGIYTPAITPLGPDRQIDRKGFAAVLESLIEAKVHGIIVGGSTGEYYAQSAQERFELAAYAKDVIGTRLALVIGTGATRTEDSVEYAKAAKEIGADAILVSSPPYALPTEKENAIHALTIDRAANLPIMLYNYPARMGITMREDYFSRVGRSKNVVAIKESSGEMANVHLLARKFPHIRLSCGWDDQALEFFAWGAKSWVCAGSNFLPREHVALYEACVLEKNFDKGRAIMTAMLPLMDFLECGKFVQSIKHGCEIIGLKTGSVRAPLRPLNSEEKRTLETVVATLKRTVAQITSGANNA
ncbi:MULTISPECIES: dihydrodipicolinate synthase family protein [Rhizobium]|uniref:Dihydrodipicolinate synthase family protein n=2 Tax=Rhizobium TaxID=379 RepID=A0ABS7LTG2_9HYPH|nr:MULTISPECIES: dihydrodipicolinate synthase family protein [Rhizobium]MBX4876556.1 dihydrodipicolinate synthase family protein [Rhizobium bangladeshense]MBX4887395.1 dihydrodipicolinate synthase family protein [Rhizobium bangladeshense]MBX4905716.1 dihydrodipicolinate synthase family protein [Rhizobium bangladeshense]MBX4910838.1 dihydrodipicolinate synthase family protein [Rhizobium bangladeshense]MBX4925733.1 dihydrodipicolinate synthase family protein [Rhizobium binae]